MRVKLTYSTESPIQAMLQWCESPVHCRYLSTMTPGRSMTEPSLRDWKKNSLECQLVCSYTQLVGARSSWPFSAQLVCRFMPYTNSRLRDVVRKVQTQIHTETLNFMRGQMRQRLD